MDATCLILLRIYVHFSEVFQSKILELLTALLLCEGGNNFRFLNGTLTASIIFLLRRYEDDVTVVAVVNHIPHLQHQKVADRVRSHPARRKKYFIHSFVHQTQSPFGLHCWPVCFYINHKARGECQKR